MCVGVCVCVCKINSKSHINWIFEANNSKHSTTAVELLNINTLGIYNNVD